MSDFRRSCVHLTLLAALLLGLTACSSVQNSGKSVVSAVQPYRMDMVQGNVVTREQMAVIVPGMPRAAVRDVLGTSLLTSVFHADRWDYVFTLQSQRAQPQGRRVTIFFKNDVVERVESDELPSEAEFASTLKTSKPAEKLPALEASPENLKKFPPATKAAPTPAAAPAAAPTIYPPLEPSGN